MQIKQLEMEAEKWMQQKVYINTIRCYTSIINLNPNHNLITFTLDHLKTALSKVETNIAGYEVESIEDTLKLVEADNKILSDSILQLLKDKLNKTSNWSSHTVLRLNINNIFVDMTTLCK